MNQVIKEMKKQFHYLRQNFHTSITNLFSIDHVGQHPAKKILVQCRQNRLRRCGRNKNNSNFILGSTSKRTFPFRLNDIKRSRERNEDCHQVWLLKREKNAQLATRTSVILGKREMSVKLFKNLKMMKKRTFQKYNERRVHHVKYEFEGLLRPSMIRAVFPKTWNIFLSAFGFLFFLLINIFYVFLRHCVSNTCHPDLSTSFPLVTRFWAFLFVSAHC